MRKNFKRATAIVMATMMVFGSAMTVFASGDTTEPTSGDTTGKGTSEGHVEERRSKVTLPTDVADSTFAFTMDPEGLIKTTAGAKYAEGTVFPESDKDTGVYFMTGQTKGAESYEKVDEPKKDDIATYYEKDATEYEYKKTTDTAIDNEKTYYVEDAGEADGYKAVDTADVSDIDDYYEKVEKPATYSKTEDEDVVANKEYFVKKTAAGTATYANSSTALEVINKSSFDIALTVKAEAIANNASTDIPLVAKSTLTNAEAASLYLGLQVGEASSENPAKAITKDTAAETTVTVKGTSTNFKIDAKEDKTGYEYRELTLEEYNKDKADDKKVSELPWEKTTFNLEGQTTTGKKIADNTTAPKVKVTWSWDDPSAGPKLDKSSFAKNNAGVTVTVDKLGTDTISKVENETGDTMGANLVSINGNKVTFTNTLMGYVTENRTFYVCLASGKKLSVNITVE